MYGQVVFTWDSVVVSHDGIFGGWRHFQLEGRQLYQLALCAGFPQDSARDYFLAHALCGIEIKGGAHTFVSTTASVTSVGDREEGWKVEPGIPLNVYVAGGVKNLNGSVTCSTGGQIRLYVRVKAGGQFDPHSMVGDLQLVSPFGVVEEGEIYLPELLERAVEYGDAVAAYLDFQWEAGWHAWNAEEMSDACDVVACEYPNLSRFFEPREVKPIWKDRLGLMCFILNQAFNHEDLEKKHPVDAEGAQSPFTYQQCIDGGFKFYSDGKSVWVERPEVAFQSAGMHPMTLEVRVAGALYRNWRVMVDGAEVKSVLDLPHHNIFTTQAQSWVAVLMLEGMGFDHSQDEVWDCFTHRSILEVVYEGWSPSLDGSRLQGFEELGDPDSPHYGRGYFVVYRFTGKDGTHRVLVWSCSPSQVGELYEPVAFGDYAGWQEMMGQDSSFQAWTDWMRGHSLK